MRAETGGDRGRNAVSNGAPVLSKFDYHLDSVLEGIRGPTPEDPEDAVGEVYDRLEERRRYVRERYGSDLTNPWADYLVEAQAWREQRALREQQKRIYEVAAAIARGDE